jgi:hypothetical protein
MAIKYTKWPYNIPNDHKIYQHFLFQGPPKFIQIGIFVWKQTIWQPCFLSKSKKMKIKIVSIQFRRMGHQMKTLLATNFVLFPQLMPTFFQRSVRLGHFWLILKIGKTFYNLQRMASYNKQVDSKRIRWKWLLRGQNTFVAIKCLTVFMLRVTKLSHCFRRKLLSP